ncbi:helix-turn-helix domain-containing protein [Pedobacter steynii]|uniref:HTH cro/C1-type domain-containing protein n=1 Tax=Pedobacter steynii TaxID=430522 RepID=A0A1D7QFR0_9SPHI|nr:helix-turn-helix transcriptional regulator [Pedobacter steynii]AOM77501.1 hypothetical protein BFS30_10175 [Pedobacter steynii]
MTRKPHLGKNVSRIRTAREMKQETLAKALGVSQQAVSRMEQRAVIGDDSLKKIAEILEVSLATIKACDENFILSHIMSDQNHNYNLQRILRLIKKILGANYEK